MGGRANIIQKIVSVLLTAAFIFFLIPALRSGLSFFGTVIIVGTILVISWSMGQFLSGERDWAALVPSALVIAAVIIFFTFLGGK